MISTQIGLTGVLFFIFVIIIYKFFRYNYLIVTSAVYDIEMVGLVILCLLNAFVCIVIFKDNLESNFLIGSAINYIGIFTLGGKITIARLNQTELE
jgi:hypothetical protein